MPNQTKIHNYVDSGQKVTPLGYFPSMKEPSIITELFLINLALMNRPCELLVGWKLQHMATPKCHLLNLFCHYFKGHHGKQFWEDVRDFLQMIEELLSNYCCEQLSILPNYLSSATTNFYVNVQAALKNMSPHLALSDQDIWGPWANKRRFFARNAIASATPSLQLTLNTYPLSNTKPNYPNFKIVTVEYVPNIA